MSIDSTNWLADLCAKGMFSRLVTGRCKFVHCQINFLFDTTYSCDASSAHIPPPLHVKSICMSIPRSLFWPLRKTALIGCPQQYQRTCPGTPLTPRDTLMPQTDLASP